MPIRAYVFVALAFVAGFFIGGMVAQYNNNQVYADAIVAEFKQVHGVDIRAER